jgi:hypothetical protein
MEVNLSATPCFCAELLKVDPEPFEISFDKLRVVNEIERDLNTVEGSRTWETSLSR